MSTLVKIKEKIEVARKDIQAGEEECTQLESAIKNYDTQIEKLRDNALALDALRTDSMPVDQHDTQNSHDVPPPFPFPTWSLNTQA